MMLGHTINDRFVRFINMSNNTLKHLFAVILPLIVGQSFVSCKHGNSEVAASLDRIEMVVEHHPDSALSELVRLDSLLDSGAVSIEPKVYNSFNPGLCSSAHFLNFLIS